MGGNGDKTGACDVEKIKRVCVEMGLNVDMEVRPPCVRVYVCAFACVCECMFFMLICVCMCVCVCECVCV
jgi:hypothetical protein